MSDFFARLAGRAVGAPSALTARAPHRFESARGTSPRGVTAAFLEAVVESVAPALEDTARRAPTRDVLRERRAMAQEPRSRPRSSKTRETVPQPPGLPEAGLAKPVGTEAVHATPAPMTVRDVRPTLANATPPSPGPAGAGGDGVTPPAASRAPTPAHGNDSASSRARSAAEHPDSTDGRRLLTEAITTIDPTPPRAAPARRASDDDAPRPSAGVAVPDLSELVAQHVLPALLARGLTGTRDQVQVVLDDHSTSESGPRISTGADPSTVSVSASPARIEVTPEEASTGHRDQGRGVRAGSSDHHGIGPRRREPAPPTVTVNIDRVVVARPSPAPRPVPPPPAPRVRARTPSDHAAYLARRREGR